MALLIPPSRPSVTRCRRRWLCVLALMLSFAAAGQAPNVEYRIKAAYIFNFAKFVTWPSGTFANADSPIVIGILGRDPFGAEIDQTVAGKAIENRRLTVKRLTEEDSLRSCHILFIASSERRRVPQILEKLSRANVLTVGETEGFTDEGGMIQFIQHENNIRFEINLEAAEGAGLKISSKLLQVATVKGKARK